MNVALEAAASGHLVIGGFSAHTATDAIDRIIDLYRAGTSPAGAARARRHPPRHRRAGAAAQDRRRTRRRARGAPRIRRRWPASSPKEDVAAADGDRRRPTLGMMPLNDALVGFVQSGAVDVREAYRRSPRSRRASSPCSSVRASTRRASNARLISRTRTRNRPRVRVLRSAIARPTVQFLQHERQDVLFREIADRRRRRAARSDSTTRGRGCGWRGR